MRRPVVDVAQEIAAAHQAQWKAKREAREELRKVRLEKQTEGAHAKVEELKGKLYRPLGSCAHRIDANRGITQNA